MFALEVLGTDRFDICPCSDANGRRADGVKEVPIRPLGRKKYLVVRGWPPSVGQCLAEAVDNAFSESIERHRIEPGCVLRAAPLAHASRKVRGGIPLEADRKNSLRAGRSPRL